MEKRRLNQRDPVFIYLIALLISTVGSVIISITLDSHTNAFIYLSYLLPEVGYFISLIVYLKYFRIEFNLHLKENFTLKPLNLALACSAGIGIFFLALLPNYGMQKLFALLGKAPEVTLPAFKTAWDYILGALIMCIIPAIGEELLFRKALADGIKGIGSITAVIICGLLFSLAHLNLAQTVHQFAVGCLLTYIYLKTDNIIITMIIHLVNNLLALFLSLSVYATAFNNIVILIICFVLGIIIAVASLILMLRKEPKLTNRATEKPNNFLLALIIGITILWAISALMS